MSRRVYKLRASSLLQENEAPFSSSSALTPGILAFIQLWRKFNLRRFPDAEADSFAALGKLDGQERASCQGVELSEVRGESFSRYLQSCTKRCSNKSTTLRFLATLPFDAWDSFLPCTCAVTASGEGRHLSGRPHGRTVETPLSASRHNSDASLRGWFN